jgi:hypothetical protein
MIHHIDYYAKSIAGLYSAGALWIADLAIPVEVAPRIISDVGLPIAFLLAVIYALIAVHRALRESEKGRREDWARFSDRLEAMVEHGRDSRERLIAATNEQTMEFRRLAEELKDRPCQIRNRRDE